MNTTAPVRNPTADQPPASEVLHLAADAIADAIGILELARYQIKRIPGEPGICEVQDILHRLTGQGDRGVPDDAELLRRTAAWVRRREMMAA